MLQPETQLDLVRARHSDLLREARAGELARRMGESRREERRSFLARVRLKPDPCRPTASAAPS
jgi:hypothetical protein